MRERSLLQRGASGALTALGRLRGAGYDRGIFRAEKVPGIRVISVGNLRTGGSGKSPLVHCLAEMLIKMGVRPAVISRGYRGTLSSRGGTVSLGDGPLVSVKEAGDEPFLAASRLSVPVFVGRDRVRAVRAAAAQGCAAALLDDGFSHRRLHRDLDILSLSPDELSGRAVHLQREPPSAVERAHLLCGFYTDYSGLPVSSLPREPDFTFAHEPVALVDDGGGARPLPTMDAAPKVYLLSGIARPGRFYTTVGTAGFPIVGSSVFPDHHTFSKRERARVCRAARAAGAAAILTTEKDLVRLGTEPMPFPTYGVRIETRIVSGLTRLQSALEALFRTETDAEEARPR